MLNSKKIYKEITKLHKNITPIDVFVALAILAVMVFSLQYFMRKKATVYVDLTFQRQDWNNIPFPPEYWEVVHIEKGSVGYNSVGKKVAEVDDIEKTLWDGGRRMYVEISIKLEAIYNSTTKTYVFDGNPLLIGKELSLQLGNTEFTGVITNIYENKKNRFDKYRKADAEITVKYQKYDPWHAESLKNLEVKNSKGELILKTKDIKISYAEEAVPTSRGELQRGFNPIKRDVEIVFELPNVLCLDEKCFYGRYKTFMIGEEFWVDSGKIYTRGGSIMSVKIDYQNE